MWPKKTISQRIFFVMTFRKRTSCDVNMTKRGAAERPFSFMSGQQRYLAKFTAYMLDIEPPGREKRRRCLFS